MLQTAIEAARKAGQIIVERFPGDRDVTVKGYRDIVTRVDVLAESTILDLIRARFKDHAILSEEASGGATNIGEGYTWVVDPLDGTTNYARHIPASVTSIGVLEHREPVVGVVYDPLRDQLFVAERGKGATLNGKPIHASGIARLDHAVVGLDWSHSDEGRRQTLEMLYRVAQRCGTVRAFGSAALMQCYVAAGWLDAYFNLMLKPWDVAAANLIVAEAGGRCTTIEGEPYHVSVPDCLVTNGLVHNEIMDVMHTS